MVGRLRRRTFLGLTSTTLLGVACLLAMPGLAGAQSLSGTQAPAAVGAAGNLTCNPVNPSPSALAIAATNPGSATTGDKVSISMEYRIANYTKADKGLVLYFPTTTAVFPQVGQPDLKINLVPKDFTVTSSAWSSASSRSASTTLTANASFASGISAYLTTAKIAVLVDAAYGNVTLEIRWHWVIHHVSRGTTKSGAWTVPSYNATGIYLPSIFYPAPWVGVVSTSGTSVPGGSTYTIVLNGSVENTWFRVVLEYPTNGTNLHSIYEYTTSAPTFNATMPMTYPNGTAVKAGAYLIHVHDRCNAIVHILSVDAT